MKPHPSAVAVVRVSRSVFLALLLVPAIAMEGQISLKTAAILSVQNSPRVKIAQDDLDHAVAALSETKDQFIPSVTATGGLGRSYGITLNVPTIFTISTQSLLFNYAQRDYIRSARTSVQAATMALADVRMQVEDDAVNTYLSLDAAHQKLSGVVEENVFAAKLVTIVQDRMGAGIESELDLKKARRTAIQIRLQKLYLEDEINTLRGHLAELIGASARELVLVPESVPTDFSIAAPRGEPEIAEDNPNVQSADANARARLERAFGDTRYTARPQFLFQAQYGRISPINDVSDYYNLHGKYDTFEAGIVVLLPLLDRSRSARSRESMSDAMRAEHEAENLHRVQSEDRRNFQHSVMEFAARVELADVELGIAQDQLAMMLAEVESRGGGLADRPMTVKDEQNARLDERFKFVDGVDARLQLRRAQVSMLREMGMLDRWLNSIPDNLSTRASSAP